MTKIKDLKNQPENNFNIIEILELVCPEGKIKYIETLLRVMKKTKNFNNYITEIRDLLKNRLKVSSSKLDNFTDFQVFFMEDTPVMVIDVFFIYPKSRQAR